MRCILKLAILLTLISGCGRSKDDLNDDNGGGYVPLSEELAQKLITPTIYYIPTNSDTANLNCAQTDVLPMKDKTGKSLANVCRSFMKFCLLNGTCKVQIEGSDGLLNYVLLHYSEVVNDDYIFTRVDEKVCRYGYGTKRTCVDPFYSVAADLSIYKAGTVIFIPSLSGILLPDGTLHSGHFIVRDSGSAIRGYGRFDFFTGFITLDKTLNPLTKAGLAWKGTNLPYFVLSDEHAQPILKSRNYPLLPE